MALHAVGALGSDAVVLLSMHQARLDDPAMPEEVKASPLRYLIALSQGQG